MTACLALLLGMISNNPPAIANGGFENVNQETGAPDGWSFTSLPKQSHLVRYETKTDPGGTASRALCISIAPDHPDQKVAYNAHQDLQGNVAGKKYRVSAKVQTRGLRTLPIVVVQCLDQTGNQVLAVSRSPEKELQQDVGDWENVQTNVDVPAGTATLRLRVGIPSEGNAGGTALIDDIRLVEVE